MAQVVFCQRATGASQKARARRVAWSRRLEGPTGETMLGVMCAAEAPALQQSQRRRPSQVSETRSVQQWKEPRGTRTTGLAEDLRGGGMPWAWPWGENGNVGGPVRVPSAQLMAWSHVKQGQQREDGCETTANSRARGHGEPCSLIMQVTDAGAKDAVYLVVTFVWQLSNPTEGPNTHPPGHVYREHNVHHPDDEL
ncbi:hypothetical protein BKA80DRAFT_126915 [Phyllosticta citrichinensis]